MEPQNLKILQNSAISNIKVEEAQPNEQQNEPSEQPLTNHKDSSNEQEYNDKLLSDIPNNHSAELRTQENSVNKQYPIEKKISSELRDVQNNVSIDNKISPDIEDPDESEDSDDRNEEWGNINYSENLTNRKEEELNNQFYPNEEKDFGENSSDFDIEGSASEFSRKKQMGQNLNQSSNIYSNNVFYNSEANLNSNQSYSNPQFYDRDQHYHQRQNEFNNFGFKNTDGKQFDDTFKRGFVGNIFKMIHGKDESVANSIINKEADRIRVYVNEVKIWMSIYKIVFSVENEQSKRRMTEEDTEYLIEEKIIDYLNRHPNEKKYKFNRVANRVFRSLKIKKCTGEYWLQELLKRFKNKLCPEIGSIKKRLIKNERVRDDDNSDSFPEFESTNYYDNGRKKLAFMDYNGSRNEGQSKTRIIESIDQEIERAILNIFNSRSRIHGVSVSSLENWYIQHGKFQLFSHDRQKMDQGYTRPRVTPPVETIYNRNNQSYNQSAFPRPNNPQSKMEILQKEILSFIKKQPSEETQKYLVYNYGLELAEKKLMIPELSNQRQFNSWFDRFISRYCIVEGDKIRIENSMMRMENDGANKFNNSSFTRFNGNDLGMID